MWRYGMSGKVRVAVIFGGRSAEHEVSIQSARNIVNALDPEKYEPVLVGIDRDGQWYLSDDSVALLNAEYSEVRQIAQESAPVSFVSDREPGSLVNRRSPSASRTVDVVFPVLHGPDGEDGTVQSTALETFRILEGRGMARVDTFLSHDGVIYVNETNTIPGFTQNSMYPKLWEASGLDYSALGDLDEATDAFRGVIETDPSDITARRLLQAGGDHRSCPTTGLARTFCHD